MTLIIISILLVIGCVAGYIYYDQRHHPLESQRQPSYLESKQSFGEKPVKEFSTPVEYNPSDYRVVDTLNLLVGSINEMMGLDGYPAVSENSLYVAPDGQGKMLFYSLPTADSRIQFRTSVLNSIGDIPLSLVCVDHARIHLETLIPSDQLSSLLTYVYTKVRSQLKAIGEDTTLFCGFYPDTSKAIQEKEYVFRRFYRKEEKNPSEE